ncbi:MAG: hypothetical protein L3J16_06505 [Anaerolineales bacterium]|nr:hypothetical protein [Anaerolineales bacterium]
MKIKEKFFRVTRRVLDVVGVMITLAIAYGIGRPVYNFSYEKTSNSLIAWLLALLVLFTLTGLIFDPSLQAEEDAEKKGSKDSKDGTNETRRVHSVILVRSAQPSPPDSGSGFQPPAAPLP